MPKLPLHFLRHTVIVEPYLGPAPWVSYGPPTPMRCLVVEHPVGRLRAGKNRVDVEANIYARVTEVCPTGSKVRLHDGRQGYATDSVLRAAGGLPTPDHLEVIWASAIAAAPPAGEPVVLITRTPKPERDPYGNTLYATTYTTVAGCQVEFLSSNEDNSRGVVVADTIAVTMPPGTTVTAVDHLRVRNRRYAVDGLPQPDTSPMTGLVSGVRVIARRVH